jgi:hypothetical protein
MVMTAPLTNATTTLLIEALTSHAMACGHFDRVNGHEPKNAPGNGVTCAVWVDRIRPIPARAGLSRTAVLFGVNARLYTNMMADPLDAIDPALVAATDALLAAYSGDFSLGALVAEIDLLGAYGEPLSALAGYQNIDGKIYRVFTINVPLVLNDVWEQSP